METNNRFNVKLTIRGTETVELNYGKGLSAAEAIASVATLIANYEPARAETDDDEFTTELIAIRITPETSA
jgi:hypothetical protein